MKTKNTMLQKIAKEAKRHRIWKTFVTFAAFCLILSLSGCDTLSKTYQAATTGYNLSASGQTEVVNDDAIVVNTEKALNIALDTFALFLKLERDNEQALGKVSPEIHRFAEKVRANKGGWIKSAEIAHDAYKGNRTSQNHANLVTAYKTLQAAIKESQKYIDQHSGV